MTPPIFLIGARIIRQPLSDRVSGLCPATTSLLTIAGGVVMGFLVSFSSVGAGTFGVTALLFLYPKLAAATVVGSDIAHAVPLTLLSGMGHWFIGSSNSALLAPLLVGSLPGVVLGAHFARHVPEQALRLALAVALFGVGIRLVW